MVVEVLTGIQEISGREPVPIDATCIPLQDLMDFDSFNSLEATCELAERLKKNIPLNENLCWNEAKGKPRNVQEMVQILLKYENSPK